MSHAVGGLLPRSGIRVPAPSPRPFRAYLHWFVGFGLTGLFYSTFAWSVLLAGHGKSRVEFALQLPLKGLMRLLEWIHCPDVLALVIGVFPPVTGALAGLLALGACWVWRALGLRWLLAWPALAGTAFLEAALLGYACAHARITDPGPRGYLVLPGSGDTLLSLALMILFVSGITLLAVSPHWARSGSGSVVMDPPRPSLKPRPGLRAAS